MNEKGNKDRFFYHSFPRPREGENAEQRIDKGCRILSSIRDFGLLLMPEQIEWHQPLSGGSPPRIFSVLQKRVSFTELRPDELPIHAEIFGQFALEFETGVLTRLGAVPVFYIPEPTAYGSDGNALGTALLATLADARAIIDRLAALNTVFQGSQPVNNPLDFSVGFTGSPNEMGHYRINTDEAKNVLQAIGHGVTPWEPLNAGITALLSFFYHADNPRMDERLGYYRQREWRIACPFAINGISVMHAPTSEEKKRFVEISPSFYGGVIKGDSGPIQALEVALVYPGLGGKGIIEMVRRVIAPAEAVGSVKDILKSLAHPPEVVSIGVIENR